MQRGDEAKPKFFEWLDHFLGNFNQICKMIMINRGALIAGVSQPTIERYYRLYSGFKYVEFGKENYSVECDYIECNNSHICLQDQLPRRVDLMGKIIAEEPQLSRIVETRNYGDKIIKS